MCAYNSFEVARVAKSLYNVDMAKRKTQTKAEKAVKRAIKKNPKAFIFGIVAIILIIAVTLTVIYFAAPGTWDAIATLFVKSNNDGNDSPTLNRGDGELQIHFIDVGQGDCILILFPDGKDMLIDWGNKSSDYDRQTTETYVSTYITDGQIDYLMLTHGDEDHVEFLDNALDTYQVSNIFMPNIKAVSSKSPYVEELAALDNEKVAMFTDPDTISTDMYCQFFIAALSEPNCTVRINCDDDENSNNITISDEENTYSLVFFCPTAEYYETTNLTSPSEAERKNAVSPIGILEYNGKKIVLTGDSNEINEPIFIERATSKFGTLDCDVLKVGHHGSATSTTTEFLESINCEYAVISCDAEGNTYKHPRQVTLDRIIAQNMSIYRTDLQGNIVCSIDATGALKLTTQRTASEDDLKIGLTA